MMNADDVAQAFRIIAKCRGATAVCVRTNSCCSPGYEVTLWAASNEHTVNQVTLTRLGQGKTLTEAIHNVLRESLAKLDGLAAETRATQDQIMALTSKAYPE